METSCTNSENKFHKIRVKRASTRERDETYHERSTLKPRFTTIFLRDFFAILTQTYPCPYYKSSTISQFGVHASTANNTARILNSLTNPLLINQTQPVISE